MSHAEPSSVIDFLRHIYFSSGPYRADDEEYRQIADDLRLFSLSAQVYRHLKQSGRLTEIPDGLCAELRRAFESVLLQNLRLKHEASQILKQFEQNGIGAIPFNGIPFAEQYYGHYGARNAEGIDILIHSSEFGEAAHAICSAGYFELANTWTGERAVFGKEAGSETQWPVVELHSGLSGRVSGDTLENAYWREAIPVGRSAYVKHLSPLHDLYMICLHGMNLRMGSLSAAVDILAVLVKEGSRIDLSQLFRHAHREGTLRKVKFALAIVYSLFPELQQIKPYPRIPAKLAWDLSDIRRMVLSRSRPRLWLRKIHFDLIVAQGWKVPIRSFLLFLFPSLGTRSRVGTGGEEGLREVRHQ